MASSLRDITVGKVGSWNMISGTAEINVLQQQTVVSNWFDQNAPPPYTPIRDFGFYEM